MLILVFIHSIKSSEEGLTPLLNDNSILKSDSDEVYVECRSLNIVFIDNIINMKCNDSPFFYNSTKKHNFKIYYSLTMTNESEYEIDSHIQKLNGEKFDVSNETEIEFHYFWNITLIDSFINNFTFYNASIFPDWSEYGNSSVYCPWDNIEYYENYVFLDKYFKNSLTNSNWRKVCIEDLGFMYYTENIKGEIIVISMPTSITILIASIIIIVAFIVSLFIIANCKINQKLQLENDSSKEA